MASNLIALHTNPSARPGVPMKRSYLRDKGWKRIWFLVRWLVVTSRSLTLFVKLYNFICLSR